MHAFLIADPVILTNQVGPRTLRNASRSRNLLTFGASNREPVGARI